MLLTLFSSQTIVISLSLFSVENRFLNAAIRDVNPAQLQFKLAPVYVIYMVCRYRLAASNDRMSAETAAKLADFLSKTIGMLHVTIQVCDVD